MIKISKKHNKCKCDNCNKSKNGYRNIHSFIVVDKHFNLCTECMSILSKLISNEFQIEFGNQKETENDIEIEGKLRLLFNRKVRNQWTDECEQELNKLELDFEKMSASNKLLYKHIKEW